MNILMISKSVYSLDVRVRREAESLLEMGHRVSVLSTDNRRFDSGGVEVIGTGSTSGLTFSRPARQAMMFRTARWLLLPQHRARAVSQFQKAVLDAASRIGSPPDVVHAHDFPALEPGAFLARKWSAGLIYDAHEYWSGLPRYGRPEPLYRATRKAQEKTLARQADRVITVSDGAAALLKEDLETDSITVVRNTFPLSRAARPTEPVGAVYAGRVGPGRDLGTVFRAKSWNDDFGLFLMGPGDGNIQAPSFVKIIEEGTIEDVNDQVSRIGISLVTLSEGPKNHDIALPNKLFQAISLGIPVVATDLPEIANLVAKHGLGVLYKAGDAESFADAILRLRSGYQYYQARVVDAQPMLTWPSDRQRLEAVYRRLA